MCVHINTRILTSIYTTFVFKAWTNLKLPWTGFCNSNTILDSPPITADLWPSRYSLDNWAWQRLTTRFKGQIALCLFLINLHIDMSYSYY